MNTTNPSTQPFLSYAVQVEEGDTNLMAQDHALLLLLQEEKAKLEKRIHYGLIICLVSTFAGFFLWPNYLFDTSPHSHKVRLILGIFIQAGLVLGPAIGVPLGETNKFKKIVFRFLGIVIAGLSSFAIESYMIEGKDTVNPQNHIWFQILIAFGIAFLPEWWSKLFPTHSCCTSSSLSV